MASSLDVPSDSDRCNIVGALFSTPFFGTPNTREGLHCPAHHMFTNNMVIVLLAAIVYMGSFLGPPAPSAIRSSSYSKSVLLDRVIDFLIACSA